MSTDHERASSRLSSLVLVIGLIGVVGFVAISVMGGQTATILSTVGSPIEPGAGSTNTTSSSEGDTTAGSDVVPAAAIVDITRPDLLVIRTGTISLEVPDILRAVDAAGREIEALGGYVSASEQTGNGTGLTSTVTYRIPVAAWDDAVAGLTALATKVVRSKSHTEDVTAQVVDLNARIANLQVTEEALQAIMAKAAKTSDVLDVQSELTKVRGQIEEAVAQRQQFKDQAAFSTLTARFGLKPAPAVTVTQNRFDPQAEVDRATARLVRVGQRAITAGIWFGIVGVPILLALGLLTGIAIAVVLTIRARRRATPPPSPSSGPA